MNERHSLIRVIGSDIFTHGKLPAILLLLVLGSAIFTVLTTHHTRLMTIEKEQLLLERDSLDIEWRNLILEENALGAHSRVETLAVEKLKMQHVDPSQENIIVKQ